MLDINKRMKQLEKSKKPKTLKKFKGEGESDTRLEPYKREKIDLRHVDDLIEEDDEQE